MSDKVLELLLTKYAEAEAEERLKREEFFDAVKSAYQDPRQAEENIAYALGRWGVGPTIEIMERQPQRIGIPRGAWYTTDRLTAGGHERARIAGESIGRLPTLAREWGKAEDRERTARNAYLTYCADHGIEPEEPSPFGANSAGAAQVPAHLLWEPDLGHGAEVERPNRDDWWAAAQNPSIPPGRGTPAEREWWEQDPEKEMEHDQEARRDRER